MPVMFYLLLLLVFEHMPMPVMYDMLVLCVSEHMPLFFA